MARKRIVSPEFFVHEGLFALEQETKLPVRLGFVGLWCHADREGRFRWRPRELKLGVLPWDNLDFASVLDALTRGGFVQRYEVNGEQYGVVPSFKRHQTFHQREAQSKLPAPPRLAQGTEASVPSPTASASASVAAPAAVRGAVPLAPETEGVLGPALAAWRTRIGTVATLEFADAITPVLADLEAMHAQGADIPERVRLACGDERTALLAADLEQRVVAYAEYKGDVRAFDIPGTGARPFVPNGYGNLWHFVANHQAFDGWKPAFPTADKAA